MLARTGGIQPPPRCRSRLALTLAEREEISRGLRVGLSVRMIAASLGRAVRTVSRKIGRNGGRPAYRASTANEAAWDRALRPKRCKLVAHPVLARLVAHKLQLEWSPYQIAGWLSRTYPDALTARSVSAATIPSCGVGVSAEKPTDQPRCTPTYTPTYPRIQWDVAGRHQTTEPARLAGFLASDDLCWILLDGCLVPVEGIE
jgi:hypothetical protein